MKITRDGLGKWYCRVPVTVVGPRGATEFRILCKRWSCPDCRKWKIATHLNKISTIMEEHAGVQLFLGPKKGTGKEITNFLQRKVPGLYFCIYTEHGSTIISNKTFPGAVRKDKKRYLRVDLPTLLESPWTGGRRISCSTEINRTWEKQKGESTQHSGVKKWATVLGCWKRQFEALVTDEEKALWLSSNRHDAKIFTAGERFLEEMLARIPRDKQLEELIEERKQKEREEKAKWQEIKMSLKRGSLRW